MESAAFRCSLIKASTPFPYGSFPLTPSTCYLCLLSSFPDGGQSRLGHPASFLTSRGHMRTSFPIIGQKFYALFHLEFMCPSLNQS